MQWHQLVGSSDSSSFTGSKWSGGDSSLGDMQVEELDRLCGILAEHTAELEHCSFRPLPDQESLGSGHALIGGSAAAAAEADTSGVSWAYYVEPGEEPPTEPPEPDFTVTLQAPLGPSLSSPDTGLRWPARPHPLAD